MVIVVIGPMGCGKSTIGKLLGIQLGWSFYDADDFHPQVNIEKMAQGIPLNDDDREPWLKILKTKIEEHTAQGRNMVLACSALKKKYRQLLGIDQQQIFSVFLKGSFELLSQRISSRSHEFMSQSLLQSQLDTLEEPQSGLTVNIAASPEEICHSIRKSLHI